MAWNSTIFFEFYLERVGSMVIILYSLRLKLSWRRCACLLWRAKLAQNGGIVLSNGIKLRLKSTLKTEFNSNNWVSKWTRGITFFKDPRIRIHILSYVDKFSESVQMNQKVIETIHFCMWKIQSPVLRKTEGPQAYSRYMGRSARAEWPTFLPS